MQNFTNKLFQEFKCSFDSSCRFQFLFAGFIGFLCFGLLNGCSRHSELKGNTTSLIGLKKMANNSQSALRKKHNNSHLREMALKDIALSLGAQSGLAYRAKDINQTLTDQQRTLDTVFNFAALTMDHNILPPVLLEGRQTLNLADTQTIRISDRTYKVLKQARFVTTAPNWRQYLWMDYKTPEYPNVTLLPKNKDERAIWRFYVEKGWVQGIEQANIILRESLARIKEDYRGMILYRKLLAQNMVSAPYVSHTDLGITGDASEIHIDDRVLRITALPELNTNSKEWKAAVLKDHKTLEQLSLLEKDVTNTEIILKKPGWRPIIHPIN